jgi:hypothetical protein
MDWEVVAHTLDANAGAYRLHVAAYETQEVPQEAEGDTNGAGVTTVRVQVAEEDFVFSADDDRWKDREAEDIAKEQRQIVREALAAREEEVQKEARRRAKGIKQLPGKGEAL